MKAVGGGTAWTPPASASSAARLVALKRYDAAIDAFARLAPERPDWDLLIVGDGEMRAWQARVPAELRHRVIWTGFIQDPTETAALYRWSHVFVHPGDYEAWGVVVLEAAAAGLAMIVSNVVGAAPDLVRDGENGRLVPRATPRRSRRPCTRSDQPRATGADAGFEGGSAPSSAGRPTRSRGCGGPWQPYNGLISAASKHPPDWGYAGLHEGSTISRWVRRRIVTNSSTESS